MANPYFNAAYYLQHNPDVLAAGYTELNAESHYLRYGADEALLGVTSRKPTPYFDVSYYLLGNPDLIVAGLGPDDAFQHFVQYGQFEQRSPAAGLTITDAKLSVYAAYNPDLREAFGIEDSNKLSQEQKDALTSHFYRYGYQEDRPGAPFDPYHPPGPDPDPTPDPDPSYLFTLTPETDTFKGGSADDTFQGLSSHLNLFDNLDGGGGHNTLKLLADDAEVDLLMVPHTTIPATVTIKNIKTVELYANGDGAAPYSLIDASRFQGATEIWQIGGAGAITQLGQGQVAGFRDTAYEDSVSILATPTATSVNIILDGAGYDEAGSVVFLSVKGSNVTTLSVSGSIGSGDDVYYTELALEDLPSHITALALALETDTLIDFWPWGDPSDEVLNSFANIKTIDAAASTGGVDFYYAFVEYMDAYMESYIDTPLALESFLTGAGNDAVAFYTGMLGADTVNFSMGAGQDKVYMHLGDDANPPGAAAINISGGAGADVYLISGGGMVLNDGEDAFVGGVTITDFKADEDMLVLGPYYDGLTEQSLVNAAIADAETIFEAVTAVANLITFVDDDGITDYATFVFDENTYVYGDVGGFFPEDNMLIQLTGDVVVDENNVVSEEPCGCV